MLPGNEKDGEDAAPVLKKPAVLWRTADMQNCKANSQQSLPALVQDSNL